MKVCLGPFTLNGNDDISKGSALEQVVDQQPVLNIVEQEIEMHQAHQGKRRNGVIRIRRQFERSRKQLFRVLLVEPNREQFLLREIVLHHRLARIARLGYLAIRNLVESTLAEFCACDTLGGVFWMQLAMMHDNFWAFWAFGICMWIWVILEIISMYYSAKYERQEVLGALYKEPVTMRRAAFHYVIQTIMFAFIIANFIHMMGGYEDAAFFKLYFWTNLMVALGPCWHWMRRGVKAGRVGAGIAIEIMIFITIIITWTPAGIGMWCTVSDFFWSPTFIAAGLMTTRFAIYNIYYQWKLPEKPVVVEGKKPLP